MGRINTVVEVMKPVYNEVGELLDVDNLPMNLIKTVQKQQFTNEKYYLLHWGLEVNFIYDSNNSPVPYSSTVAICQHIKTGVIETFIPGAIKVLGVEINK